MICCSLYLLVLMSVILQMGRTLLVQAGTAGRGQVIGPRQQRPAAARRCWWCNSDRLLKTALTIAYFDKLGVPRLS